MKQKTGQGGPAGSAPNFYTRVVWTAHRSTCTRCALVQIEKPASLAFACLEGARLFKSYLSALSRRNVEERVR